MTQPALLPHAKSILERLNTTDLTVGDHKAPKAADQSIVAPCVVLYLRPGGLQSGDLGQPEDDAWLPFQLTCVGKMAAQAMWVADVAHTALTSSPLQVEGRSIARLRRTFFGANAQRDDDVTPPLFYVPVEYRLWSFTAAA